MKSNQKQLSANKIEITFEFEKNDIEPYTKKAAENLSANMKVDGFREGKVPENIVKQTIGDFGIFDEALRLTIQDQYPKYIEANNISIITQPDVTITKFDPASTCECKITVEIIPSIPLKNYRESAAEIAKTKQEVKLEEKEVADTIKWVLESRSSFIELTRPAQDNDIVDISYDVIVDGENQEELKAVNYKFIVSKEQTFPELNTEVIGMKKDDTKDIAITFKKDFYIDALKEKTGILRVTLNKILQRQIPELTDEFVKTLGKFENVEAFKKNIRDGMLIEKQLQEEDRIKIAILTELQKDINIELPETLIVRESDRMIEEIKYRIGEMGMNFEDYLKQINKSEEDIRKDIRDEAKRKVLNALILREIINLEKITASPEEIYEKTQQIINDLTYQNPNAKDIDMETLKGYSEEIIKNEKVFNLLMNIK